MPLHGASDGGAFRVLYKGFVMTAPAQVVQLTCPNCGSPMRAQIVSFIDVGQQPQMKSYLLSGQMNTAQCQTCGNVAMLAAPLIYHDPAKQLFLTHFPQQLNAKPQDQERFIGDATAMLMRTLPPEAPKGYILAPKRFLTMNSLIEAVLEADGVTKEMIETQRRQVDLISELAETYEQQPEAFPALVESRRNDLDAPFFTMLDTFVASAMQSSRDDSAQMLLNLRNQVAELVGYEGEAPFVDDEQEEAFDLSEVLQRLTEASDEKLEQQVAELRPALDYAFFEALTAQIDAATQAGDTAVTERLTTRRAAILEIAERQDREAQALFQAGSQLLGDAIEAADPAALLRERRSEINEAFLLVIDLNRAAAERNGQREVAERLDTLQQTALAILEESLTPEERFINQLLAAETPQEATTMLRQNAASITVPLVKKMNELADEMERDSRKPIGERLRQLAREAGAMLF